MTKILLTPMYDILPYLTISLRNNLVHTPYTPKYFEACATYVVLWSDSVHCHCYMMATDMVGWAMAGISQK